MRQYIVSFNFLWLNAINQHKICWNHWRSESSKKSEKWFFVTRCRVIRLSLIELEMFGARILTFNSFHLKWFRSELLLSRTHSIISIWFVVLFGKCLMKERKIASWIKQQKQKRIKTASKNKARMLYLNASQFYWIHAPLFMSTALHCSSQHCQFLCMCCAVFI